MEVHGGGSQVAASPPQAFAEDLNEPIKSAAQAQNEEMS